MYRHGYLLAVYSGGRAVYNQARAAFLPRPRTCVLDAERVRIGAADELVLRVHARRAPGAEKGAGRAGVLSARLVRPGIPRPLYAWLCLTSHFGCGHVELAFYEDEDRVVVHGVRDIVRSNVTRLGGWGARIARRLATPELEVHALEVAVFQAVSRSLQRHGLTVELAAPEECVALSVDERLLRPDLRERALESIRKRYARLERRLVPAYDP